MRKLVLFLTLLTLAIPVFAQTVQQDKIKACNIEATRNQLKGEERKTFMKGCASADRGGAGGEVASRKETAAPPARMEKCNADATTRDLRGGDRRTFMKACLSAG